MYVTYVYNCHARASVLFNSLLYDSNGEGMLAHFFDPLAALPPFDNSSEAMNTY